MSSGRHGLTSFASVEYTDTYFEHAALFADGVFVSGKEADPGLL